METRKFYYSLYQYTINQNRIEERHKVNRMIKTYESLKDKNTDFAKEVKAILDLRKKVLELYIGAPDSI